MDSPHALLPAGQLAATLPLAALSWTMATKVVGMARSPCPYHSKDTFISTMKRGRLLEDSPSHLNNNLITQCPGTVRHALIRPAIAVRIQAP